jgi:hypothetical protein
VRGAAARGRFLHKPGSKSSERTSTPKGLVKANQARAPADAPLARMCNTPKIVPMSSRLAAEVTQLLENSFGAVDVGFANEMAVINGAKVVPQVAPTGFGWHGGTGTVLPDENHTGHHPVQLDAQPLTESPSTPTRPSVPRLWKECACGW